MALETRDAMVDAAWRLIAERGLEGMSIGVVLDRTGAPRGSVYHYFPGGRAELIEHAIARSRAWTVEQFAGSSAADPESVVRDYLAMWRHVLELTEFRAGCAIAGVVTGTESPDLLARGADAFAESVDLLADKLQNAGVAADVSRQRARVLVAAAEGAVLMARAQHSIDPLTEIGDTLVAAWQVAP